jgi:hypothetical protein
MKSRKFIFSLNEWLNEQFNPHKYESFSELTEKDLYDIGKWGLENDFSTSGAWDGADNLEEAIKNIVDGFKLLLKDKFPDGFNEIPNIIKVYRFIILKSPEELNTEHLGYSWFSNPERITNPYFKQQMWHLKEPNLYLITAEITESKIDVPRSLFQRDMVWVENEIVLKDDTNIKILSLDKIH